MSSTWCSHYIQSNTVISNNNFSNITLIHDYFFSDLSISLLFLKLNILDVTCILHTRSDGVCWLQLSHQCHLYELTAVVNTSNLCNSMSEYRLLISDHSTLAQYKINTKTIQKQYNRVNNIQLMVVTSIILQTCLFSFLLQ